MTATKSAQPSRSGAPSSPAAAGSGATAESPSGGTGNLVFETEVVSLVNAERAKAGCPSVTVDARLTAAARRHSADMAARGFLSHTTVEGIEFTTRITDAGYPWSAAAENIAKGQPTARAVMTSWSNSSGHRASIVNCAYRNIGVGVVADKTGTLLWTQDFTTPL